MQENLDEAVDTSVSGNRVRPLSKEELAALTKDLQDVLIKHNAEMGVTSTINLVKVVETQNETTTDTEAENSEVSTDTETKSGS